MEELDNLFVEIIDADDDVVLPRPRRYIRDIQNPLEFYSDEDFRRRYRFSKHTITDVLLPLIFEDLDRINNRGLPIPPIFQLLIALRFYALNSFQVVHGDLRGFSQPSVSRTVKNVSILFARQLGNFVHFPRQLNEARRNTARFFNIANFPNVSGCIDCTHIAIGNPGGAYAEVFRNRKGWFSLNVQVTAGPNLEILDIVVRHPGSSHDSLIFNRSALRARLQLNEIPGLLLGDSAYACTNKLLTPFLNPRDIHEEAYNFAHIRTRNLVERLFGIWKRRFFCLRGGLRTKLRTSMAVICATAVLYNIGLLHNDNILDEEFDDAIVNVLPAGDNNAEGLAFRTVFAHQHF